jgi:hypothetical protein
VVTIKTPAGDGVAGFRGVYIVAETLRTRAARENMTTTVAHVARGRVRVRAGSVAGFTMCHGFPLSRRGANGDAIRGAVLIMPLYARGHQIENIGWPRGFETVNHGAHVRRNGCRVDVNV